MLNDIADARQARALFAKRELRFHRATSPWEKLAFADYSDLAESEDEERQRYILKLGCGVREVVLYYDLANIIESKDKIEQVLKALPLPPHRLKKGEDNFENIWWAIWWIDLGTDPEDTGVLLKLADLLGIDVSGVSITPRSGPVHYPRRRLEAWVDAAWKQGALLHRVCDQPCDKPPPCLSAALEYAARGWKIFPAVVSKKKSHKAAKYSNGERWGQTKDPEQIKKDFKQWPNAGIGLPTGAENGIFVVEADTPKGHNVDGIASLKALEAKHGKLPDTLMAMSPSGSPHRYFKHPGGCKIKTSASEIAPGVDVKGDGGMVIAPPSTRSDGRYRWLNELPIAEAPAAWLLLISTSKEEVSEKEASTEKDVYSLDQQISYHGNRGESYAAAALRNVADELRATPESGRNNKLNKCAFRMGTMIARDWIAREDVESELSDAAKETGLEQDETSKTIQSGITAGLTKPHEDLADNKQNEKQVSSSAIEMICAAEVKMKPKEWLWEGHLLRGALQLMTGLPGLGKSQVQIHFMACVTAGLPWPDGARAVKPMNVIMVTAEDAIDSDVVPRLKAAGADLTRVHILKYIKIDKKKRQFLLAEDLAKLEQAIVQVGNVGLVCIDPITAYMGGKTDAHKTTEVRSQLGPLKDLSEHTNVAVSAITHPAKNAGARAIDHFIASQAFIAAARVGHACFEELEQDEDGGEQTPTGRTLFTHVKHSGSRKMPTLAYKIEVVYIQPEPFVQIETTRVVWEKGAVNISADQAAVAGNGKGKAKAKEEEPASELMDCVRSMVDAGHGWCKQAEIASQAKALGYSDKELRTVRKRLALTSKRKGGAGKEGWWELGWEGKRPIRF
jgi:hypothetical protein